MRNDDFNKELRDLAPGLEKLKGDNPFQVPDHYFETLPENISTRIHSTSSSTQGAFGFFTVPRLAIITAAVLLFAFAGYFFYLHVPAETYLTEAEQELYDNHLAWYSNYQTDAYYDIIMENDYDTDTQEMVFDEEEVLDYLLNYTEYYLDFPPDATDDLW
jgi:hypothetical protein